MPAYHYMQFYHCPTHQSVAGHQGYLVLSIISQRRRLWPIVRGRPIPPGIHIRMSSLAASTCKPDPMSDPNRVGSWDVVRGLAHVTGSGTQLRSLQAGVDLAGVHIVWQLTRSAAVCLPVLDDAQSMAGSRRCYSSQGDDDRNVAFQQMTGLVATTSPARRVYETHRLPDDVHESLLHSRWIYTLGRMETFLHKFLWRCRERKRIVPMDRRVMVGRRRHPSIARLRASPRPETLQILQHTSIHCAHLLLLRLFLRCCARTCGEEPGAIFSRNHFGAGHSARGPRSRRAMA